jgi:hypothetical protein
LPSSQEVDYGKIKEKYDNFTKFNKPFLYTAVSAVIAPLTILLALGRVGQPNYSDFQIVTLVVLAVLLLMAWYFYRRSRKYRLTLLELSFMRAFEITRHLRLFADKELETDKANAMKALKKLLANHDNKWLINQKLLRHDLDDFDYLMNPTVKLILTLQNSYLPLIKKGDKKEIIETMPYFEKLTNYFHEPSQMLQNELFDSARPAPLAKDEQKQARDSLKASTWVRHSTVFVGAIIASIVAFFLLLPLSPDNVFQPLMAALAVVFGISGVYAAFLRK